MFMYLKLPWCPISKYKGPIETEGVRKKVKETNRQTQTETGKDKILTLQNDNQQERNSITTTVKR